MKHADASGRVISESSKDCRPTMGDAANATNGNMVGHGGKTSYPGSGGSTFPKPPAQAKVTDGDHVGPPGGKTSYPSKKGGNSFAKPGNTANVSNGVHVGPSNNKSY